MTSKLLIRQTILVLYFWAVVAQGFAAVIGDEKISIEEKKDTASAVVVYGDTMLLSTSIRLQDEQYRYQLDSLLRADNFDGDKVAQLKLLRSIDKKSVEEIAVMIDSLFALEAVPYALINEINLYVAILDHERENRSMFLTDLPHNSPHPAYCFYDDWDDERPYPYRAPNTNLDSAVVLKLRDTLNFCDYQHPHLGPVTSRFGWRYGRAHKGIDVDLEVWDPVHSAFAGQVRVARYYGGYGRVVVVRHYNGLETLYAHLHRFKVKAGDYVEAGDVIGLGGSSGRSTGSHLHFEVRFKGEPINPEHLICFKTGRLLGDTLELTKMPHWYAGRTTNITIHKVQKGEYLHKIATRYGVSISKICHLNGIRRNSILRVGQTLRISG